MADEEIKTLAVKIALEDGSFTDGIKNLQKNMNVIDSQFKASTAGVKDWGKSLDGLKSNAQALGEKINVQKQIISAYSEQLKKSQDTLAQNAQKMTDIKAKLDTARQAYEQSKTAVGANDDATKKLKEDLDKLEKQYTSAESVVKKNNTSVQNYTVKLNDAQGSLNKMESELKTTNTAIEKQTSGLSKLADQAGKTGEKLKSAGDKISDVGGKLTLGVTAPIVAAGTAASKMASDYNESLNKVDVAFGASASSVEEWSKTTLEKIGLSSGSALDAAATYGDMATSMGFTTGKAADMAKTIVELSGDMSSFKNIPISESQTALNAIFTGETESLKKLGIVMTEANLQQYASTQGIQKNVQQMSEQEKVQLRYNYILSVTKNSQGDFARTSESNANQMRSFTEGAKELGETFGQEILPQITPLIKGLNDGMKAFGNLDDGTKKTIVTFAAVAAATGPVVTGIGKITKAAGDISSVMSKVISSLTSAKTVTEAMSTESETASASVKGIGSSFASIAGPIAAGIALIVAFGAAYQSSIDKAVDAANKLTDEKYDKMVDNVKKDSQTQLDGLEQQKTNLQNSLIDKEKSIDVYYDKKEKNLESDLKAQKKALEDENTAYKKAYDERIELLDKEKEAREAEIDAETNAATSPLQAKINAIDAQTAAEEKAIKDKENSEKLAELKAAVDTAKTDTDKKVAKKSLDEFTAQLDRERLLAEREQQKQSLQDQITAIQQEATRKKQQVDTEIENQKKAAEKTLEIQQQSVSDRLDALDGYVEREKEKLEVSRTNAKQVEENKTADLIAELNKREQEYQDVEEAAVAALEAEREEAKEQTKEDYNKPVQSDDYQYFTNPKTAPGGAIPVAASGNDDFIGGPIRINEEGGEILNLPRHTQIIPHDISMEMARAAGSNNTVSNNYYPAQIVINLKTKDGRPAGSATVQLTAQQLNQLKNDRANG